MENFTKKQKLLLLGFFLITLIALFFAGRYYEKTKINYSRNSVGVFPVER